jgi:hypothetical protein
MSVLRRRDFEGSFGTEEEQAVPAKLMPKRVKRKRTVDAEGGGACTAPPFSDRAAIGVFGVRFLRRWLLSSMGVAHVQVVTRVSFMRMTGAAVEEEYYDYIFGDDPTSGSAHLKILERAMAWKKQKTS